MKKHTHSHSMSNQHILEANLDCSCPAMWPTWSWQFPDIVYEFLVGHQTSPRTATPTPQAQEHLTTHRDHWTKADQENLEESAGQGNCRSMLNTASDSWLYCLDTCLNSMVHFWPPFNPHYCKIWITLFWNKWYCDFSSLQQARKR